MKRIINIPEYLYEAIMVNRFGIFSGAIYEVVRDSKPTPTGECRTCKHRDPEDKKCDCGGQERQGCSFPVSDDYFCKFYEKSGEENEVN